jgi:hypothetical protein
MLANRKLRTTMTLGAALLVIIGKLPITIAEAASPAAATSLAPSDIDAGSSHLLAAAEPFEALTEMAFSSLGLQLKRAIIAADAAAKGARGSLPEASLAPLDARLSEIHEAYKSDDRAGLAISSVEVYRILVSAAHPGKVPTAVNLMDYAGFRYDADFKAKPIRWQDMKEAAAYAREQWASISDKIADRALKETVDTALTDMELGAAQQNTFKARRSVNSELRVVDQLEKYFSKR